MTAKLTFFPVGDADTLHLDLADDCKVLVDFARMRNRKVLRGIQV